MQNNSIYFNAGNAYVAQGTNPDPVNGWGSNANIRIFGKVTSVPDDGLDNSGATNRSENFILGAYVDKDGYVQNPTSKMLHPIQLFTGSVYSSYRLSEGYIGGIDYSSTSLTGSGLCTTGALVECGSGRFRYNVDQKTPGYANMKGSGNLKNGINILYREQPQISASIQAVPNPLTYGDILSSVSVVRFNSSIAGYVNGDGLNSNFGEISYDSITLIKGSLSET
ncbi:MAG: hypothetical protein EBV81_04995, partial [Proteobacteria bacterium]|nr:hypothetical protein [Candidatus Fonsibacter sp. PEL5]